MLTLESQAQVGELGSLLEITFESHRQVLIPLRKFHLGPILGNLIHRLPLKCLLVTQV